MAGILAIMSITPTYSILKIPQHTHIHVSSPRLLRTICTYKWNLAKNYLDVHPEKQSIQAGYHISKWEWWVVRSELGYLQCTIFNGQIMSISPLPDDDLLDYVVSSPPDLSPITIPVSH